jgi:hypothetical protein
MEDDISLDYSLGFSRFTGNCDGKTKLMTRAVPEVVLAMIGTGGDRARGCS